MIRRLTAPALLALLTAAGAPLAEPARAGLPPEDRCPLIGAAPTDGAATDALPVALKEGRLVGAGDLLSLRNLLPREIWVHREEFFHNGMRMEIGACHRRYPTPPFFTGATEKFAGRARLDDEGNLLGYVAGVPFPQDTIEPKARDAGARWAWNFETRYRGAGPAGRFRLVDIPRADKAFEYLGSFFFLQTLHRADLPESDFAVPEADGSLWISGGRFDEPFGLRHLAWKQIRPAKAQRRWQESDDTFVYVPTMRKVRRASTSWVDGVYSPRYRAGGDAAGGGLAIGGDRYSGAQGAIQPNASRSAVVTEASRTGFIGLSLRPNAYAWRVVAEREVLAPLNGTREGWPRERGRNYGPSGMSVGSDRWDVRWAVVLRGERLERNAAFQTLILWVDYQTLQPLYVFTKKRSGKLVDVSILVHRFSGDVAAYPEWPSGVNADVFDPVAQVTLEPGEGGAGWRRESYDVLSIPPDPSLVRRYVSTDYLLRGR